MHADVIGNGVVTKPELAKVASPLDFALRCLALTSGMPLPGGVSLVRARGEDAGRGGEVQWDVRIRRVWCAMTKLRFEAGAGVESDGGLLLLCFDSRYTVPSFWKRVSKIDGTRRRSFTSERQSTDPCRSTCSIGCKARHWQLCQTSLRDKYIYWTAVQRLATETAGKVVDNTEQCGERCEGRERERGGEGDGKTE
eukprot:1125673-Rhodomonas_salina.1